MLISPYSFRLLQCFPLATQASLHLSDSEWLWHLHCQHSSAAIPAYLQGSKRTDIIWGCVKQAAVFNLQTVCLVFQSRTVPAYITSLQWIGSSHATMSVGARGPQLCPVRATERSVVGVHAHCQVSGEIIPGPERKIHCLWKPCSLSHYIFRPEQIQNKKVHKVIWCSISTEEMLSSSTGRLQLSFG